MQADARLPTIEEVVVLVARYRAATSHRHGTGIKVGQADFAIGEPLGGTGRWRSSLKSSVKCVSGRFPFQPLALLLLARAESAP
jgi:hypothetical protein